MVRQSQRTLDAGHADGPDDTPPSGSMGIDDSSSLACAVSTLTPDDQYSLSHSLSGTDDRDVDDLSSTGCGFLSNLY